MRRSSRGSIEAPSLSKCSARIWYPRTASDERWSDWLCKYREGCHRRREWSLGESPDCPSSTSEHRCQRFWPYGCLTLSSCSCDSSPFRGLSQGALARKSDRGRPRLPLQLLSITWENTLSMPADTRAQTLRAGRRVQPAPLHVDQTLASYCTR